MDLVVHEMVEFHNVRDTYGHFTVERFTGAAVLQGDLTGHWQPRFSQQIERLLFRGAIEHRRRQVYATAVLLGKFENIGLLGSLDEFARLFGIQIVLEPSLKGVGLVTMVA